MQVICRGESRGRRGGQQDKAAPQACGPQPASARHPGEYELDQHDRQQRAEQGMEHRQPHGDGRVEAADQRVARVLNLVPGAGDDALVHRAGREAE